MGKNIRRLVFIAIGLLLNSGSAMGASLEESFKGETINFIVGYSPGGLFDTYTRLIARYFGKHVPGNPIAVVQNMPGAGGILAANHVYNRAKPDGLTIGAWASPLVLQNVMGNEATKFDGRNFGYLGVPSAYDTVCTLSEASGIKTPEDWLAAKRPVRIGGIAPGTGPSDIPKLMREAIGMPMQIVEGFKGAADVRLAIEGGELEGFCGPWQSVRSIWRAAFDSGKMRPVLQATLKAHPELKAVPLVSQYAKTPEARALLKVADDAYRLQFPYTLPPGTPRDRLQILQKAFLETFQDPELVAEAQKSKLEIDPVDGSTTGATLGGLYKLTPGTIERLKAMLVPGKK